jgi:uncharacterized repeat protein (TIGR02543 family)
MNLRLIRKITLTALTAMILPFIAFPTPAANAAFIKNGTCEVTTASSTGVVVYDSTLHCYIAFRAVGTNTWVVPEGLTNIEYLVVGGGGAGVSGRNGGGGGGGGFVQGSVNILGTAQLEIVVGAGGLAETQQDGFSSSIQSTSPANSLLVEAYGGKNGNGRQAGSSGDNNVPTATQGFAGHPGVIVGNYYEGGGGGGAAELGGVGDEKLGGDGRSSDFLNSSLRTLLGNIGVTHTDNKIYFAGGGGGGVGEVGATNLAGGVGGLGGGGTGGGSPAYLPAGISGLANTGGGGGGAGTDANDGQTAFAAGNGGSGVVVIRYSKSSPRRIVVSSHNANYLLTSEAPKLVATTTPGGGTITYYTLTSSVCTVDLNSGQVAFVSAGVCTIKAEVAEGGGYAFASTQVSFNVNLGDQTITWNPDTELALTTNSASVGLTLASLGAEPTRLDSATLTYTVVNAGTTGCTLTGTTIKYTAVGTCEIKVTAAATAKYSEAIKTISFNVTSSPICDNEFGVLNFDYRQGNSTYSQNIKGNGTKVGDKILYKNVTSKCGGLDAVVTTSALVDATFITGIGYDDDSDNLISRPQFVQANSVLDRNGYAEFTFEFFKKGTYTTPNPVQVTMRNITIETQKAINGAKWFEIPEITSYTYALSPTALDVKPAAGRMGTRFGTRDICKLVGNYSMTERLNACRFAGHIGEAKSFKIRFGRSYKIGSTASIMIGNGDARQSTFTTGVEYKITYDLNYANAPGFPPAPTVGRLGAYYTGVASVPVTRAGYTLVGWNTKSDGSGKWIKGAAIMPYQGYNLYAIWKPNNYTLSYNLNGAFGLIPIVSHQAGTSVKLPQAPDRPGFTFTGWNTVMNGGGTSYPASTGTDSFFTMPTAATTLYATWTKTVRLTYSLDSGTANPTISDLSVASGSTQNVTATVPTKADYWFGGWNTAADGSGVSYAPGSEIKMATADVTLHAVWVSNSIELVYNANGGFDAPPIAAIPAGNTTLSSTEPTRVGYTFNGWVLNSDGSGTVYQPNTTFNVTNNVTLYAKWTVNNYTLSYNANGGSGAPSDSEVAAFSAATISSTAPTRPGFTFIEWNAAADGTGQNARSGVAFNMPAQNVTLYAQWQSDGGTLLKYFPLQSLDEYDDVLTSAGSFEKLTTRVPTRTGYVFGSWNTSEDGTGTSYLPGQTITMPVGGLSLYAQWAEKTFTITYFLNGGTTSSSLTATASYGSGVMLLSAPTRADFDFVGWADITDLNTIFSPDFNNPVDGRPPFIMPANDVSLVAQWKPKSFNLSYNFNGGTGDAIAPVLIDAGNTATITLDVPKRTGYWFGGWNTEANGTGTAYETGGKLQLTQSLTLHAIWYENPTPTTFMLSYNANGGTEPPTSVEVASGTDVTLSTAGPVRPGYTFDGWSATVGGAKITTQAVTANTTVYARWTVKNYVITYGNNGGTGAPANSSGIATDSSTTIDLTKPTRADYIFTGWNTSISGNGVAYASGETIVMPPNDLFLYAMWTPVAVGKSKVIYNATGGVGGPEAAEVTTGSSLTLSSEAPVRDGYTFAGWSETVGGNAISSVTVSADMTVYARWNANTYSITYDANGGSGAPSATNHDTGANAVLSSAVPTRSGYLFNGWSTTQGTTGTLYSSGATIQMPPGDLALFASWIQLGATLAYNPNGGTGTLSQTVPVGSTPTLASETTPNPNFLRTGFSLKNWNSDALGSGSTFAKGSTQLVMPAENTVLYANWEGEDRTLAYNGNAESVSVPASGTVKAGASARPATDIPTRTGFTFIGWNSAADGTGVAYPSSQSFLMPDANLTLYAQWAGVVNRNEQRINSNTPQNIRVNQGAVQLNATTNSGLPISYGSGTPNVCTVNSAGLVTLLEVGICSITISQSGDNSWNASSRTVSFAVDPRPSSGGSAPSTVPETKPEVKPIVPEFNGIDIRGRNGETTIRGIGKDAVIKIVTPGRGVQSAAIAGDKVTVTPASSFSGKTQVVISVQEGDQTIEFTIPVLVNPGEATTVRHTPTSAKRTTITWNRVENATSYQVVLDGRVVCRTNSATCTIPALLGPNANLVVISQGGDSTVAQGAASGYVSKKAIPALNVYFGVNSAAITPLERAKIVKFAQTVTSQGFKQVRLDGHTDGQGGANNSVRLSANRTNAVAKIISQYVKVKITKRAAGEKKPAATNATAAGQAKNRRVEGFVR